MKFTGLILMCASSCLALLLPALGIVKFPKVSPGSIPSPTMVSTPGYAGAIPQNAPQTTPLASTGNASNWLPASSYSNSQAVLPPGQLVSSSNLSPMFPAPEASTYNNPSPANDPSLINPNAATNSMSRFGMGIWLLLGPVCLIGLAIWTFSPNPSGTGRKS
jgi:hypothetical protein